MRRVALMIGAATGLLVACGANGPIWVEDPLGPYEVTCEGVDRTACLETAQRVVPRHRAFWIGITVLTATVRPEAVTICSKYQTQPVECRVEPIRRG